MAYKYYCGNEEDSGDGHGYLQCTCFFFILVNFVFFCELFRFILVSDGHTWYILSRCFNKKVITPFFKVIGLCGICS